MEEYITQNQKQPISESKQNLKRKPPQKNQNSTVYYLQPSLEEISPQEGVFIIIQARLGSTRLKEKILLPLQDTTLLEYLVHKIKKVRNISGVVLATSTLPDDDRLEVLAQENGILCVRGSQDDVLSRFVAAINSVDAKVVVRITADCPLHDPRLIESAIDLFQNINVDYLSNTQLRTYPRGFDIEIIKASVLKALTDCTQPEREHVTLHIYTHPEKYQLAFFCQKERDDSGWRLTVDEQDDYKLVQRVAGAVAGDSLQELQKVLDTSPEWGEINQHVQQKIH